MTQEVETGCRAAAVLLVECLERQGVDRVFCVPGESYLAASIADAYGKLTGRPGGCFVTRGPGAAHAVIAVHTAFHDSSPMGCSSARWLASSTTAKVFQEVDLVAIFRPLAKWLAQIAKIVTDIEAVSVRTTLGKVRAAAV